MPRKKKPAAKAAEPAAAPEPAAEEEPLPAVEAEPQPVVETESQLVVEAESQPDVEVETKPDVKEETKLEADAETKPDAQAETKLEEALEEGENHADTSAPEAGETEPTSTGVENDDAEQPGAGSKRGADSAEDGEDITSPERPRRRQKSGWDSQEAPDAGISMPSTEPLASTPSRVKVEGPPSRDGDWTCPSCGVNCFESKTSCFKCHTARPGYEDKQKPRLTIPNGWLECAAVGDPIATPGMGAGFLPMKVPLSEDFSDDKQCQAPLTAEQMHTPKGFLKKQQDEHSRKVGMVVDLTFTAKYYDGKKEFEAEGVEYLKIMTQGGGMELPKKPDLETFATKVSEFFKNRPDELCAVHCTHGINRSGYFIVTFLIEQCKMDVKEALASFATARAPGIWDNLFIDELYAKHGGDVKPSQDAYPAIPPWSKEKRRRDYDERRRKIIDLPKFAGEKQGQARPQGGGGGDDDARRRKIIDLPKFAHNDRNNDGAPALVAGVQALVIGGRWAGTVLAPGLTDMVHQGVEDGMVLLVVVGTVRLIVTGAGTLLDTTAADTTEAGMMRTVVPVDMEATTVIVAAAMEAAGAQGHMAVAVAAAMDAAAAVDGVRTGEVVAGLVAAAAAVDGVLARN
eukprot:CAMPEP_0179421376 /NCGR_PEP_ID=MMETSP0799-20121207/9739_1 /TAXON_ID=46947 /ORGANISM="Geminigera cryophila, Strain CCMP2564" /LENGTH=627 /DNA_ID=CAMNT_0021195191 /DNA_START=288 /DNA_END=2169 /DNA_ORIENTATION=+